MNVSVVNCFNITEVLYSANTCKVMKCGIINVADTYLMKGLYRALPYFQICNIMCRLLFYCLLMLAPRCLASTLVICCSKWSCVYTYEEPGVETIGVHFSALSYRGVFEE